LFSQKVGREGEKRKRVHTIPGLRLLLGCQIIDGEFDIMPLFEAGFGFGF
jgi:hypothetical protein